MKTYQILILYLFFSAGSSQNINFATKDLLTPEESDVVYGLNIPVKKRIQGTSNEDCVRRIYRQCNYPTHFTDEELENVRQFLNYSFSVLADIKPYKPLCPKLHVRHDWKCLSQKQRTRVINVWQKMYEKGIVQRLTDLHVKVWPAWHKTVEFMAGHRWFANEFEKQMRAIDPPITLPYWDPYTYGVQPERSSVWDTLGHSGNYSNGHSVPDGIYAKWGLTPSMKRHWSPRGTIYPWFTQEMITSKIQTSNDYSAVDFYALAFHFPPHLGIGGYEGQYAVRSAPYDALFYMHHTAYMDLYQFRNQLQSSQQLVPLSFNQDGDPPFDQINGKIIPQNIQTNKLTGVPGVFVKELFWVGFGDLCYIPDQLVRPINNLMKGIKDPIPSAVKRMPRWLLKKYFPRFYSGNFTGISHTLEEVGDCNRQCRPIPKPTFMRETEIGRRQFAAFRYDNGKDTTAFIRFGEQQIRKLWHDLNKSGYCSPYVTT